MEGKEEENPPPPLEPAMATNDEEAREQTIKDNKKRFEELGIREIAKCLSDKAKSKNKSQHHIKPNSKRDIQDLELRRSPRAARNRNTLYSEVSNSMSLSKERAYVMRNAEKFRKNLKSRHPCLVKPVVQSNISGCFLLVLNPKFCLEHLPSHNLQMVLEDEDGVEYNTMYIASRGILRAGWRKFAMDHNLDVRHALIFELREPARFKVYIFKASDSVNKVNGIKRTASKKKITGRPSKAPKLIESDAEAASKLLEMGSTEQAKSVAEAASDCFDKVNGIKQTASTENITDRPSNAPKLIETDAEAASKLLEMGSTEQAKSDAEAASDCFDKVNGIKQTALTENITDQPSKAPKLIESDAKAASKLLEMGSTEQAKSDAEAASDCFNEVNGIKQTVSTENITDQPSKAPKLVESDTEAASKLLEMGSTEQAESAA